MNSAPRNFVACDGMMSSTARCGTSCPPVDKPHCSRSVKAFGTSSRAHAHSFASPTWHHSLSHTGQPSSRSSNSQQKRQRVICAAETPAQPSGAGEIREIPIFPLQIVAFPGADVPLNIFEARYRVLFNTLLAGAEGIEEDLVNDEKPWHGSRLFGLCFVTNEGSMASIGTTLKIQKHHRFPDGRMGIVSKGMQKFQVVKVVENSPVVVCQVKMLEDSDDQGQEVSQLAQATVQLFKDLISLNVKMQALPESSDQVDSGLDGLTPREVTYRLAGIFQDVPILQQSLLEETKLEARLNKIKEILEGSTNYLRAQVALKSAFTPASEESSASESESPPSASQEKSPGKAKDDDEPLP